MSYPFIGEIRLFAGSFAPIGWAFCNGALQSIAENTTLFALIGTTYGGDGQSTFALPDLRGRVPVHQGPGYVIGQAGGSETVTLASNQLPAHTHVLRASTFDGRVGLPDNAVLAAPQVNSYGSGAASVPMATTGVSSAGGSQPHDNMAPYTTISYIIALFGIYPSQN
jgi:microcystin-dependent protein